MRFIGLCLFACVFSVIAQEKDYSLFANDTYWPIDCRERIRLESILKKDWGPFLKTAQSDPLFVIERILAEIKHVRIDYTPDKKLQAYRIAECAMIMAKVLDQLSSHQYRHITKSQIHREWRFNNKNVSWVLASCRKHPEKASIFIERFKQNIRAQLAKELKK
ncbi:MAG: hypothetical protein AMXMBFR12_08840 [Candidatus Babeliales bacterium]